LELRLYSLGYLEASDDEGDDEGPHADPGAPGQELDTVRLGEGEQGLQHRGTVRKMRSRNVDCIKTNSGNNSVHVKRNVSTRFIFAKQKNCTELSPIL
jgi:hypothetical protein